MTAQPQYDDSLTIALLRARESVTALFREHVAAAGLTLQQWRVIRALADEDVLDTTSLAERCVILAPSLTRIINHLLAAGLIEQVATKDRRQRAVRLTDKGHACFDSVWITSTKKYQDIEAKFGGDEIKQLVASLNRLRAVLDAQN